MKNIRLLVMLLSLVLLGANGLYAQHDDMYYDPQKDKGFFSDYKPNKNTTYSDKDYYDEDEEYYDDEDYAYYDDYDYYYSSRIRRFHRPYYGFNFFDPVYVDMSYYDPFISPGMTMLIYDDMFAFNSWYRFNRWNSWNRWNRWNNFGWGPSWGWNGVNVNINIGGGWGWNRWNNWNNFGWGPSWGYNSWNSPFSVYNYYNFGGGGYYCPPTWGNNYVYNTVNNIRDNTYYGPRMGGTTKTPGLNGREIRRETPTDVTNSYPNSTTGVNLGNDKKVNSVNPTQPEREVTGREKAHTERISIFDEKEKSDYSRTIEDVRSGRTNSTDGTIDRRDLNNTQRGNSRVDRRWNDSNSSGQNTETRTTRPRSYEPSTRTRKDEAPRTRSTEPTRRSNPNNEIRRNNDNNRSSSPSWDNNRSSSPRSDMGSSRSSGSSPSRSSGSNSSGSSNSRSSSGSSSKRGGN